MIVFACFSPHPPILLPKVGSPTDRAKVKKTSQALEKLGQELAKKKPDCLYLSSPHPDWGFNVPLHFLTKNISGIEIKTHLTDSESPGVHFERGRKMIKNLKYVRRLGWIASGDMSHKLKEDGPYGLHPSGPKFDQKFIELLKKKDIQGILNLSPNLINEAGQCGLNSFCMLLGALEASKINWQPKIMAYEAPFGVGYLTARLV